MSSVVYDEKRASVADLQKTLDFGFIGQKKKAPWKKPAPAPPQNDDLDSYLQAKKEEAPAMAPPILPPTPPPPPKPVGNLDEDLEAYLAKK
mmetsp:Transcript_32991/g.50502  ORF Transcript_32991/g.50502 Transcript_32991/m.50502 type:complete len:91 (-) Transcript_32991:1292-1564(-)